MACHKAGPAVIQTHSRVRSQFSKFTGQCSSPLGGAYNEMVSGGDVPTVALVGLWGDAGEHVCYMSDHVVPGSCSDVAQDHHQTQRHALELSLLQCEKWTSCFLKNIHKLPSLKYLAIRNGKWASVCNIYCFNILSHHSQDIFNFVPLLLTTISTYLNFLTLIQHN